MGARMVAWIQVAWRVAFAIGFCTLIFVSAFARAPRQALPSWELRRLIVCALTLYAVGAYASVTEHKLLAGFVLGSGILVSALAAWLSRGRDQEDPPPEGHEPIDEQPPPEPDGVPRLDWAAFERDFRAYDRRRSPVQAKR
jgi:hypothetical protein